ncbi:hypothetical protein HDV64DRAFT_259477 [Trichoderma sp. TUCIM 5745]
MIRFIKFILVGLPAFSSMVQAGDCKSNDIEHKNVLNCNCVKQDQCPYLNCATVCGGLTIDKRKTTSCVPGCTDADLNCYGCGVWFNTLCNRVKDCLKGKDCDSSGKVQTNGPMVWVYLPGGNEPLITTTDRLAGIEGMADHPIIYKDAFNFAQDPKHFDPNTNAMVLNSLRARTMEQFHIHKCFRPTTTNPRALARLDHAPPNPAKTLVEIPKQKSTDPRLWCKSVAKGQGPVTGFVEAITELFHRGGKDPICKQRAGAGVLQDNNGRRWGCVTDNSAGPLPYFCSGTFH